VIDLGEDHKTAAIREMQEETGYHSDEVEFLCQLCPNPAINNNTAYFYLAKNAILGEKKSFDAFEDIEICLFTKEEFLQLLRENKIQHGVQLGPIYEALLRLNWIAAR
jgi:8-oxo-dGTP pyrophosphatase MutT (NUDIX family)